MALHFSIAPSSDLFAGDHRGVVIPVPIPNTEVKGSIAEGSAGLARARVGRRRLFFAFFKRQKTSHLTHLIHMIGKPRSNVDSFCGGLPINESRESSETAEFLDLALRLVCRAHF